MKVVKTGGIVGGAIHFLWGDYIAYVNDDDWIELDWIELYINP